MFVIAHLGLTSLKYGKCVCSLVMPRETKLMMLSTK